MLSALALGAVSLAAEVPLMNLDCVLAPADSKMSIQCSVVVPRSFVKGDKLKFDLGDQMSVPEMRVDQQLVTPNREKAEDHDVTYSIAVVPGSEPVRIQFTYASVAPRGRVYFLSAKECFAGGYNTLWFPSFTESRRSKGTLTFHGPADFTVKASGREISARVEGNAKTTVFQMENPMVATFAAAPFHVTRVPGKVPVTLYLLKPRPIADDFAQGSADVISVLQGEFGPYPYPDFSIIETPSPESSELGFSGASFEGFMFGDSNSIERGFNLAYFGHEIGHQWWGNLIGTEGSSGSYALSEAMAQYGSLQAVTKLAGVDAAKQYRLNGYPGYSDWQCMNGALAYAESEFDAPLSSNGLGFSILLHQLADSKGFLAWETVAQTIGRGAFHSGLKKVLRDHGWGSITWPEFWRIMQSKSKVDLGDLKKQWFEQRGLPVVSCEWKQVQGKLEVTLKQSRSAYRLYLPLVIDFRDGTRDSHWVHFDQVQDSLSLSLTKPVLSAALDPDHVTLHSTPELEARAKALSAYARADFFLRIQGKTAEARAIFPAALDNLPNPDPFGAEFLLRFTYGGMLRREGKLEEAKEQLTLALQCSVRKTEFIPLTYLRLALIAKAETDEARITRCLAQMRSAEAVLAYPSGAIDQAKSEFPGRVF